ncbi:MAG: AMP-binding protein, partial [Vibrio sp.]
MLTLDTWQDSQFDDVLAIDLITHWAQVTPNAIAWKSEQASLSWQQLAQLIQSKAKAMVQQGVESGQVIALVGKNSPELVLTYLASLTLGMTPALIAPAPECTIVQKCQQVGARWRCQQTQLDAPAQLTPISQAQPMTSFHAASLVFTSGSTGHPKAVAHASKAHLASAQGLLAEFEFTPTDIWLLSLPIYHVSGLGIIWRWLYRGACLQHASDDLIADLAKVTHASLVAVQLARFLDAKGCREPNQLKRVLLGGSHIPFELTQKASKAGIDTWLGYGMTETASTVTAKRCDGTESAGR